MRTLSAAIARVRTGTAPTVVVRGGLYRQAGATVPTGQGVRIVAYPGEIPEFRGSKQLPDGWVKAGAVSRHAYTPRPVTDGGGISFSTGQNLQGNGIGKYPDQAWVGGTRLRQVTTKDAVVPGTFYVDRSARQIYLSSADVQRGGVEVSSHAVFLTIKAPGTVVEGIRVARFSNGGGDRGVIRLSGSADHTSLRNVEILDASFQAVSLNGSGSRSGLLMGTTLRDVTISGANWMGITADWADDLTLRRVLITSLNSAKEFKQSPASGALKATRTRRARVLDSLVRDVVGHGIWFDQSSAGVVIAGNDISGVTASSVFFELADDLLLINNRVTSNGQRAVKLAGASGLKLVNNTLIGAADTIGIYVDSRSKPGCANPTKPLCAGGYDSDRDKVRAILPTLDWIPRLDLMINNIVASPKSRGYCGAVTTVCITARNDTAQVPISTVIHKADASRGIPQTRINSNVYVNPKGPVVSTHSLGSFATPAAFGKAMAGSPVRISGIESTGKSGSDLITSSGQPTAALLALRAHAVPIPVDATLNAYLPAGTQAHGAVR